ncbi:MAG: ATP-binding cassette domain-containing protein [Chitinispirillaceae bacterium]|nr:ATP-binding cassette domain-containing protein [Chitinispirillaceae bacterium]
MNTADEEHHAICISGESRVIVDISDFAVTPGAVTFLFGESGIGKSLLCKALYGLLDPDELRITIDNSDYAAHCNDPVTRQRQSSGFFVFQEPSSHLNPLMRVGEQLCEGSLAGATNREDILKIFWQGDTSRLQAILPVFPKPYRPSGGEKQRALLAMAFMKIAQLDKTEAAHTLFVFDEPTGSLDNTYRNLFLDQLYGRFARNPFTAIVITHDYSIISEVIDRHGAFTGRTRFRELVRAKDAHVALRDFSTDRYFSWMKTVSPQKPAVDSEAVLTVASGFSVFGRQLQIYSDAAHTRQADLVIRRGEMAYVKAPSGVGKTTLAKIILGLYKADKLSMKLCGLSITESTPRHAWESEIWGRKAGMIFQHADEALDLESTVKETFDGLPFPNKKISTEQLVTSLKELFDGEISHTFLSTKVKFLSGGQKQRLNLLRTLILRPALIILDEPLNGLDFDSVRKVISLLEEKRRAGSALLMISHNEEIFDAVVAPEQIFYLA